MFYTQIRDAELEPVKTKTESQHQMSRQDSFVNEVMMETEALINIVEATGVESESDGSSEGMAGSCTDIQR